jgi:hypothetical protein
MGGRPEAWKTVSDFFSRRYGNKYLAGCVCHWYRILIFPTCSSR